VFGTATGGEFIFGNDPSTFGVFPSGDYTLRLGLSDAEGQFWSLSGSTAPVPEPSTYALWMASAFAGVVLIRRLRRSSASSLAKASTPRTSSSG
jgi:hypothetical protein